MYPLFVPSAPTIEKPKIGRPTLRTEEIAQVIEDEIRETGMSLATAGPIAGISADKALAWRAEDQAFARRIARAKSDWLKARLVAMQETDPMTGLLAHPAQVSWLISKHFRSQYGDKIEHEHTGGMTLTLVTPEQLAQLQERKRAISLPEASE